MALNINHANGGWWSIAEEYAIAGHAIDALADGRKNWSRSPFHYRSMATALAAIRSLIGDDPIELPTPQAAATAYHRVARVQAVKCVPLGTKSYPTPQMMKECPPRYAQRELEILRPGVLVALGVEARAAVRRLGAVTWKEHGAELRRGTVALASGDILDVLAVPHPTATAVAGRRDKPSSWQACSPSRFGNAKHVRATRSMAG